MKNQLSTLEISIEGMDCAECTSHVQSALKKVPGVQDAQVFLASEKAIITHVERSMDMNSIRRAVSQAGYHVREEKPQEQHDSHVRLSKVFFRLLAGIAMLVILVVVLGEWLGLFEGLLQAVPLFVWPVVIMLGGWSIFVKVVRVALDRRVISHTLMTLGVIAAAAVGAWPTALVVVLFMRVGDYVESYTSGKARSALKGLAALAPQSARVERDGQDQDVPISEVLLGDVVIVRPGEIIPVDGEVIAGSASVNQSSLSGESIPVETLPGNRVMAASVVERGMLKVRTSAVGADTTFGQVIRQVEEAEGNRADVQRVADVFAGYLLPLVLLVALLTMILRRDPLAAAAVLVVACSCSFALATPIAMLAAIASAAQKGLLIKGGKFIELLDKVDVVFMDKTGTLTLGKPLITDVQVMGQADPQEMIRWAAAVERYSEHPLADAVREKALQMGLHVPDVEQFENLPGTGVRAVVENRQVSILNQADPAHDKDRQIVRLLREQGKTLLFVQEEDKTIGLLAAEDVLRKDAHEAVDRLKNMGLNNIILLSGDHEDAVRRVADRLGIAYRAGLLPQDKIELVKASQKEGHVVAMIGDGINDAPALAQADVGIAMGVTGSDISNQAASITLLREDWLLVPALVEIARRTMRVVRGNIIFTLIYNLLGLSLASLGWLPAVLAAALQSLPDVGILVNSSRLLNTRNPHK